MPKEKKDNRNPLELMEGEEVKNFDNNASYFFYLLKSLYIEYPKGNIDYLRFMARHSRMDSNSLMFASEMTENCLKMGEAEDSWIVYVNWRFKFDSRLKLAHLVAAMHLYMGKSLHFDYAAFFEAYDRFFSMIERTNE